MSRTKTEAKPETKTKTHRLDTVPPEIDTVWDPTDKKSVASVREVFDGMMKRAYVPHAIDEATGFGPVMKKFDPDVEHVTMVGPLVGG